MITIAWDIDDTLNDLMRQWFEKKWLPTHKNCSISHEELIENPPHKILGVSKEEYLTSLDEFRLSQQYMEMKPVAEIEQWFDKHGDNFKHIAITAVPARTAHTSASWLLQKFGRWIRMYHFIPSWRQNENLPVYDHNKQEALKQFKNIDVFIDDNEFNLTNIDANRIKGILFPRPWNKNTASIAETLKELTDYVYQLKSKKEDKQYHD
jgi:uncharacterized HAD superfamily protein